MSTPSLEMVAAAPEPSTRPRRRLPPSLIAGSTILGIIIVMVVAAPLLTSHNPTALSASSSRINRTRPAPTVATNKGGPDNDTCV